MLILKGEQDMEKLDTAKESVRKEMYCVLYWYWYLLVRLNARAGPSNCTKRQGTSGCREKKGKKHKTKQKSGAGIQPPDAQIAHIPAFRSITEIHRIGICLSNPNKNIVHLALYCDSESVMIRGAVGISLVNF